MISLSAFSLAFCFIFTALAVDIGYMALTRAELERTADAAALAGVRELVSDPSANPLPVALEEYLPSGLPELPLVEGTSDAPDSAAATDAAQEVARYNPCGMVAEGEFELLDGDVEFQYFVSSEGYAGLGLGEEIDSLLDDLGLASTPVQTHNCVRVTSRLDSSANDPLDLLFSTYMGNADTPMTATASAHFSPAFGAMEGADILPFALDVTVWSALRRINQAYTTIDPSVIVYLLDYLNTSFMLPGTTMLPVVAGLPYDLNGNPIHILDRRTWTPGSNSITTGPDGVFEVVVFPNQFEKLDWPNPVVKKIPGNIVGLDLGFSAETDLDELRMARQIADGLTSSDIEELNNSNGNDRGPLWLPFNAAGTFQIPVECEADLTAIIGQPRILPLYATIPGAVAMVEDLLTDKVEFEIVGWAAVVITDVGFDGQLRYLKIQAANYIKQNVRHVRGPNPVGNIVTDGVYAGPFLVQ